MSNPDMDNHEHRFCRNCRTCREHKRSHSFGRMATVIPDPIQVWVTSILLPCDLNNIAKGLNGFEELKKYIRQGSDFCKDVSLIVQERAELESAYSKGLSKVANKLIKSTQNSLGTLAEGWKAVAANIEIEADLHKNLAQALLDNIAKPLKHFVDAQHKARKPVEATVDKALKSLTDKRVEENKAKRNAFECAKTHEKIEEAQKSGKAKTDKDINKTEKQQEKKSEALRKADRQYCELCEKGEVARQEWDFSVSKADTHLQALEQDRLGKMSDYLSQYNSHISVLGPRLTQSCDKLHQAVVAVDVAADIQNVAKQRGSGPNIPEQILIESYAEDSHFTMKPERRKTALQTYILHLRQSIEREQKGREGVEKLVGVYTERPHFADQDAQDEAKQRLSQVIFMMNFLEANHYKIASSLANIDGQAKPTHMFSKYIEQSKDKQGITVSVLKLPLNLAVKGRTGYDATNVTIGALASDEPFVDEDEFDDEPPPSPEPHSYSTIGRCRAIFDYQSTQADELSLCTGNVINLYDKQPDGWWHGEFRGKVGLFPASYVEEI